MEQQALDFVVTACPLSGAEYHGPIADTPAVRAMAVGMVLRCPGCGHGVQVDAAGRWSRHDATT